MYEWNSIIMFVNISIHDKYFISINICGKYFISINGYFKYKVLRGGQEVRFYFNAFVLKYLKYVEKYRIFSLFKF